MITQNESKKIWRAIYSFALHNETLYDFSASERRLLTVLVSWHDCAGTLRASPKNISKFMGLTEGAIRQTLNPLAYAQIVRNLGTARLQDFFITRDMAEWNMPTLRTLRNLGALHFKARLEKRGISTPRLRVRKP